jgi:hypothetical protein
VAFVVATQLENDGMARVKIEGRRQVTGRLAEIVENVRANEELYRNLEYTFVYERELLRDPRPGEEQSLVRRRRIKTRCVWQNGMAWLRWDYSDLPVQGAEITRTCRLAYDGRTTRILDHTPGQDIVNIHDGLFMDSQMRRPHTLLLINGWLGDLKLSEFLTAAKFSGFFLDVSDEGEEVVDGLRCFKLRCDVGTVKEAPGTRLLWVCPDRNYFPKSTVFYEPAYSAAIPLAYGDASDFREVEPGVWMPFRCELTINDETAASEGRTLPSNRTVVTIESVDLHPSYDVSFFRDVPIPDGAYVVEFKDGEAGRSYWNGEPPESAQIRPLAGGVSRWWWAAVAIAVALVIGGLMQRQRGAPAKSSST